ncbi:MAG: hypothetical protein J5505_02680 [Spirochaetaceae bacterium]|nr:hypothetical protein [Spirochaetaceae bacterium]
MNFSEVQDVIQGVFTDFRVILCTICVIAYLELIAYIVNYHKKPKRFSKKKLKAIQASVKKEEQETGSTDAQAEASAETTE